MKKILIFIAFSAMFFLPASAMAAGDYSCWCGDTANGAQKTPMQLPDDVSAGSLKNDCIEFCEASNMDFVVFTNDANLEPGANLRCWRADECAEKDGVWRTEQASDCKQGYHYCDVKPTPIPLTVAIGREGTVTSVESL
ncbi:hypothetical protein KKG31_08720, partial [Patescibacteria group bacterium]|nr:hypothetical protein [Patescibacteria group bacterium]